MQCQRDAYALTYRDAAAARVLRRDKGICADCGIDTFALRDAMRDLGLLEHYFPFQHSPRKHLARELAKRGFKSGGALWHMHHVRPVAKGGSYELSNLVTLCLRCHKARHRTRERTGKEVTQEMFA